MELMEHPPLQVKFQSAALYTTAPYKGAAPSSKNGTLILAVPGGHLFIYNSSTYSFEKEYLS